MKRERRAGRSPEDARKFVEALARGLEVLGCFHPGDGFLGNQEIARRTGLPKSTITRLTYTLEKTGHLAYSASSNKYCLGNAVIGLGYAKLARMDIRRVARPLMQALAEHTQASVNLGIRDRLNMIYIDTYRSTATFTVQLDVGSQIPIATTSMGRACLAALPEEERSLLLDQIRLDDEQAWPAVREGIETALADYKASGYCMSLGNWRSEVHAVAVPLVMDDGTVMVFSCSGASFQLSRQMIEGDIAPRLMNLAGNVRSALLLQKN